MPFDRAGAELLFNLLAECYERRSVVVTSNLAFSEWTKVLAGDEKLTTALLDRLAHHATVITTKGRSYRMRHRAGSAEASAGERAQRPSRGAASDKAAAAAQAEQPGSTARTERASAPAKKSSKKRKATR